MYKLKSLTFFLYVLASSALLFNEQALAKDTNPLSKNYLIVLVPPTIKPNTAAKRFSTPFKAQLKKQFSPSTVTVLLQYTPYTKNTPLASKQSKLDLLTTTFKPICTIELNFLPGNIMQIIGFNGPNEIFFTKEWDIQPKSGETINDTVVRISKDLFKIIDKKFNLASLAQKPRTDFVVPTKNTTIIYNIDNSQKGGSGGTVMNPDFYVWYTAWSMNGGLTTIADSLDTKSKDGILKTDIPRALSLRTNIEFQIHNQTHISLIGRYLQTKFVNNSNPLKKENVDTKTMGGLGLLSLGLFSKTPQNNNANISLVVGGHYEQLKAGAQQAAIKITEWTRYAALGGLSLQYGYLQNEGLTFKLTGLFAPYGANAEKPLKTGAKNSLLGGMGLLQMRYQMPTILNNKAGLFFDLTSSIDLWQIKYTGTGTRIIINDNNKNTTSGSQNITRYDITAGVGLIF